MTCPDTNINLVVFYNMMIFLPDVNVTYVIRKTKTRKNLLNLISENFPFEWQRNQNNCWTSLMDYPLKAIPK